MKLHTGCGPIRYPGWVNVDIEPSHNPDVVLDVTKDLLAYFGPESVDYHLNTHSLEHYTPWPDGPLNFLRQAREVLKPGGVMRIAVPDLGLICKAYAAGSDLTFIYHEGHKGFYHYDCPAERLLYFTREWGHTFLPDFDLLRRVLVDAGFDESRIVRKQFNDSAIPGFHYDRYESESLYVEATK